MNSSPIQEFYKGKSILITGGSGFVGQIIIEKLLRCCDVKQIFVLIRCKKGKTWNERINEIFEDQLFDKLKLEKPDALNKVRGIVGDCTLPNFGIKPSVQQTLVNEVNIVFHGAATVRFDEHLSLAMQINVHGTQHLIELCRRMTRLEVIIHISTAYSNCNRLSIEEKIYDPPLTKDQVQKIVNCLNGKTIDKILPAILAGFPNTYVFTKCLAESVIAEMAHDLPVVIFRPAIVMSTEIEPIPGWINNYYGPIGIIYGVALGVLHVFYVDENQMAEMVPVDKCVNALLASAWDRVVNNGSNNNNNNLGKLVRNIPVYNFVPNRRNMIDWRKFCQELFKIGTRHPPSKTYGHQTFTMTTNPLHAKVLHILYHLLPAVVIDWILMMAGQKFRLKRVYEKSEKLNEVLNYFTFNQFAFEDTNVRKLWHTLTPLDQKLFAFDMSNINWEQYLRDIYSGMREYVLHDKPETIPQAQKRQRKIIIAHYLFTYTIKALTLVLIYVIFNRLWQMIN